jgi:hypothetical protein
LGLFAGTAAASPPTIDSESVTGITPTNATLNAEINPNGLLTKYKLQIDTTGNFRFFQADSCPLHPPGIVCAQVILAGEPLPPGLVEPPESTLPAGTESQHVSVNLSSIGAILQPGTTYHFRVIATNNGQIVQGPDQTFTTTSAGEPPAAVPPSIDGESVSNITQTDATLEAQINPEDMEWGAIYQFQVVANPNEYLQEFACPTEGFPAGSSLCLTLGAQEGALPISWTDAATQDQSVGLDLASAGMTLEPGTTYHYRVITARSVLAVDTINWEDPIVYGADQTFTTQTQAAPPVTEGELETTESLPTDSPSGGGQAAIANPTSSSPTSLPGHRRHGLTGTGRCNRQLRGRRHRRGSRKACTSIADAQVSTR